MRKIVLSVLMVLLVGFQLAAQNQRVSGTVTGPDGDPLVGVAVVLKGTNVAAVTNIDGQYSVNVPANAVLEFSYLGLETQEIAVGGRTAINVRMLSDTTSIDEVVVSVYGTNKSKNALSGSVSSISGDLLNSTATTSFDEALAGKMAGVQVTTASGLLADGTSIRIRGTNSISMSSQPLVVIDGVPLTESTNLNIFNSGNGTRFNPMATINQNDIESVEVLKDAAAAALYGSRAANGVILITTKRGKPGSVQVSYSNYFGWSQGVNIPDMLNAEQFIEIQNEAAANWWGEGTRIADYPASGKVDTNWMDLIYRTGFSQNHSMSVMGGTEKFNFYGSADWLDQDGIVMTNSLNRYAFRATMDAQPTKWFKAGVSVNYSKTENMGVLSDGYLAGVTIAAYLAMPNVPERNEDGSYALTSTGLLAPGGNLYSNGGSNTYGNAVYHPSATLALQRNANISDRIGAVAYATITPLKGLSITSKIGLDNVNNFEDQYSHPSISGLGYNYNGMVQDNIVWINQWNWQNYANYNATFGNHSIGLMAGLEYQDRQYKDIYAGGYDFTSPDFQDLLDGLYTENMSGGSMNSRGFQSLFGNISYNYKEKYYLDAYFRRDGYSGFGEDNQHGFFPGVSAAWRITEEDFMASTSHWLSALKLRGSWGIVGNSNIGPYASRTLYSGGQYAYLNGISMGQVGNSALQWETTRKFDVGFDLGIFNGRVELNFDYWRTDISDMLLDAEVLLTTGIPAGSVTMNYGKMSNSGIELQINTVNYISPSKDFVWSSTINFTTVKNRVTKLNDEIVGTNYVKEGQPIGVWWVYEWGGVDPETGRPGYVDQASNKVKYYDADPSTPAAERWKFADGSIAPAINSDDNIFIDGVNGSPKWYGNFDNTLKYKNFDFNLGLQFAGGYKILNVTRAGLLDTRMGNKSTEILDRWQKPGDVTDIPKLVWGQNTGLTTSASTRFLEKGDFLRIRDITIGYTLPHVVKEKLGFTGRVFARVNNLYTFTGYTGSDPEISTSRNANVAVGRDNRSVPAVRTFTVGLNLNF